jgi:hypothetical protein
MSYDDKKPTMIAVVTDAGLLPAPLRHTVEREYGHTYEKYGWIELNWEKVPGGLALDNDTGDSSGIRRATILVSMERALQAMSALARNELVC